MLSWYCQYHEAYGWTVKEVDESDLSLLIDELVMLAKKNNPNAKKRAYIENVLPF